MVIAACGSSSQQPVGRGERGRRRRVRAAPLPAPERCRVPRRSPSTGGTIRDRQPEARLGRPGRDAGPRRLRHHGPVVRVPVHRSTRTASNIAPGLALKWTPNADGTVWTFDLRQNVKWHDGTPFTADDVVATMERLVAAGNSGLKGVLGPGGAVATDANTVTFTLVGGNGNFPYLVSVFNAQTLITPKAYAAGTTLDKARPARAPGSSRQLQRADRRHVRAEPGLVGRQDAARRHRVHLLRRDRPDGHRLPGRPGRRHRPVRRPVRARRCSTTRTSASSPPRRRSIARSGCARTRASSPTSSVRQALALTFDRPALIQQLFKGKAAARQRPCHLAGLPVLRLRPSRSGPRTSTRPSSSCRMPAWPT